MSARIVSHGLILPPRPGRPGVPALIGPLRGRLTERFGELRVSDRFSQMALAAATVAVQNAGYSVSMEGALSCVLGTAFNTRSSVEGWLTSVVTRPNPVLFPSSTSAVTIGHIARAFSITRSVAVLNTTSPLPLALRWLRSGRERLVLVVATEELMGAAPEALIAANPATSFSEASAALLLAADEPPFISLPRIAVCATGGRARDGDLSQDIQLERGSPIQDGAIRGCGKPADGGGWGFCSAGTGDEAIAEWRDGCVATLHPRRSIGDTLGASSLVALCVALREAHRTHIKSWLVDDVDRAGGCIALRLEAQ